MSADPPAAPPAAGRYRHFLIVSLLFSLTFGALLGAATLAALTAPWIGVAALPGFAARVAHGHAQVFGFAALFVMGVAYHALPRIKATPLAHPRLAAASFWPQTLGVLAIAAGAFADAPLGGWLRTIGALGLVLGAAAFARVVDATLRAGGASPEGIDPWLRAGCAWLVIAALLALAAAAGLPLMPAAWDAALYGFVASWILGLSLRMMPAFLRLQANRRGRGAIAVAYQAAVAAWVGVAALWPWQTLPLARAVAGLAIAGAVVVYVARLGLVGRAPLPDERIGERFFDAAYGWLAVWLLCVPVWGGLAALAGGDAPPPVTDFGRHAFTLGFLTQMIVGVAMRILPVLSGATLWSRGWRTATFWLLNATVAMRGLQVVVALGGPPALWPWVALSGALGIAAMTAFTVNLAMTLRGAAGPPRLAPQARPA